MIQLDFFDYSIVNNLVPVKTMKPDKIIFFIDRQDLGTKQAINTKKAVEKMIPGIVFEYVEIDSKNIYDIHKKLVEEMIKISMDEKIYMDLTGGNSLMAITAHRIAREFGRVVLMYADLYEDSIFEIHTLKVIKTIEHITLDDYLNAKGAKTTGNSRHLPEKSEYDNILKMAEYIFDHLEQWKFLCQIFQKKAIFEQFKLTNTTLNNEEGIDVVPLMNKFVEYGFLNDEGNSYYSYPLKKYKEYLITFGIWLELYIFIKAEDYFDDRRIGYMIDWNANDELGDPRNEIDVVVMKQSIPYFISCKMKKPSIYDLYEVGYLAYNFAGDITNGIMATTYCAEETDKNYSTEIRCREMQIGMIKTCQFKTESEKEIFEKAMF